MATNIPANNAIFFFTDFSFIYLARMISVPSRFRSVAEASEAGHRFANSRASRLATANWRSRLQRESLRVARPAAQPFDVPRIWLPEDYAEPGAVRPSGLVRSWVAASPVESPALP